MEIDTNAASGKGPEIGGMDPEEFLARVEQAARDGAREGSRDGRGGGFSLFGLLRTILFLAMLAGVCWIGYRIYSLSEDARGFLERDIPVEERDLTLENNGVLGYTAVDFQEAILGRSEQMKKLEVYKQEVTDAAQLSQTGLGNLKVFSKTQLITYHGTATYTVDLSKLSEEDITLDEETQTIHLVIPHAAMEPINIPEDAIEFGDVSHGLLARKEMDIEPEDMSKIQKEARARMEAKLQETDAQEEADRFAKMSVWEIYQPIINKVTSGYSLEVEMEEGSEE